jgi:hypothetical protein
MSLSRAATSRRRKIALTTPRGSGLQRARRRPPHRRPRNHKIRRVNFLLGISPKQRNEKFARAFFEAEE